MLRQPSLPDLNPELSVEFLSKHIGSWISSDDQNDSLQDQELAPDTSFITAQKAVRAGDQRRASEVECCEDGQSPCMGCLYNGMDCSIPKKNSGNTATSLQKSATIYFPECPPPEYQINTPLLPRRFQTTFEEIVEDHKRRVALTLRAIDRGLPSVRSEATALARNEASMGTSIPYMTSTFSETDGPVQIGSSSPDLKNLANEFTVALKGRDEKQVLGGLRDDHGRQRADHYYDHPNGTELVVIDTRGGKSTEGLNIRVGQTKYSKIRRGLSGFINATRVSAIADTGSAQNIISAAYASDLKLPIQHASTSFQLGNSKVVQSVGTVRLPWAFAEDPTKKYDLLFHVLPTCIYDVILGSSFLTATETLSKYGRRLTECVFSVARVFKFGFLGNRCHRLEGVLDDVFPVLAVPDTGAERNVMDAWYAMSHNFDIDTGPGTQNFLQFADGTYQETIGQVTAYWTFASGEKALLTFEVLEDCASEVVIGEDSIFEHNIFANHASSLRMLEFDCESYELAPFDFISSWQQKYLNVKSKLHRNNARDVTSPQNSPVTMDSQNERLRRDIWNHRFEFGSKAPLEEIQAETKRRSKYEMSLKNSNPVLQGGQVFRMPSMTPSSSGALLSNRAAAADVPNFLRPRAP